MVVCNDKVLGQKNTTKPNTTHWEEIPCFSFHAQSQVKTSTLKPEYLHISLKLPQWFEEAHMHLWHKLSTKQGLGEGKESQNNFSLKSKAILCAENNQSIF